MTALEHLSGPSPINLRHHHPPPFPLTSFLEGQPIRATVNSEDAHHYQYYQRQRSHQLNALSVSPSSTMMKHRHHDPCDQPQQHQAPTPYGHRTSYDKPDYYSANIMESLPAPLAASPPPYLSAQSSINNSSSSSSSTTTTSINNSDSDGLEERSWGGRDDYHHYTPQHRRMGYGPRTLDDSNLPSSHHQHRQARVMWDGELPPSVFLGPDRSDCSHFFLQC